MSGIEKQGPAEKADKKAKPAKDSKSDKKKMGHKSDRRPNQSRANDG